MKKKIVILFVIMFKIMVAGRFFLGPVEYYRSFSTNDLIEKYFSISGGTYIDHYSKNYKKYVVNNGLTPIEIVLKERKNEIEDLLYEKYTMYKIKYNKSKAIDKIDNGYRLKMLIYLCGLINISKLEKTFLNDFESQNLSYNFNKYIWESLALMKSKKAFSKFIKMLSNSQKEIDHNSVFKVLRYYEPDEVLPYLRKYLKENLSDEKLKQKKNEKLRQIKSKKLSAKKINDKLEHILYLHNSRKDIIKMVIKELQMKKRKKAKEDKIKKEKQDQVNNRPKVLKGNQKSNKELKEEHKK